METARNDFSLLTQAQVLEFIANGGLEKQKFQNSEEWKNNPNRDVQQIYIDAYSFFSGMSFGYIAFLFQPTTNKWIIKSLKENDKPDPRNLPFSNLNKLIKGATK